jgi:predicted nucleic acid-binding protein
MERFPGSAKTSTTDEFVDTNVFIYAHDRSAGRKHAVAADLLARLWEERSGAVSIQVLVEFYAATIKRGLKVRDAEAVISDLETWTIHRPHHADVIQAIELLRRYKISWWDAQVINSANELGCAVLWTEDLNHGRKYGRVTVRNPFL